MKNTFRAPNSKMTSASQVLANSGLFQPKKTVHWSQQKAVPHSILVQRAEDEAAESRRTFREEVRARMAKRPVFGAGPNKAS